MSDEANVGLASEPADKTLDSILDSAIAQHDEPAGETKVEGASPTEDKTETKEDKTGRLHAKDGKFAPKNTAAAASTEQAVAATTAPPKTEAQPAQVQPVDAPHTWAADDKAKFATWPRDVQEAVVSRYKAMEADYTRKTQETAEFRRSAEPLLNAVKPFEEYLTQLGPVVGRAPHELIADLLRAEYQLRTGDPQTKAAALAQISVQYGIDLAALARGEVAQTDPTINNLRQELSTLQQWKSQFEQNLQQQQSEQATLQIDAFASSKDEAGRPRYPHFERVRGVMVQHLLNGEAKTLEEAYQKAAVPIHEAVAQELASRQQQADTQRKDAIAKAEKAAPVRSSGSQPGGTTKGKDLDSILDQNISKHFG